MRLAGRSYVAPLGVAGGFGAGMAMSESRQLPVRQPVELLAVQLVGDSQVAVALVRRVVKLWLEVYLHWC